MINQVQRSKIGGRSKGIEDGRKKKEVKGKIEMRIGTERNFRKKRNDKQEYGRHGIKVIKQKLKEKRING